MKRAGGWTLGLLIVAAMAGGAWFALRPALNRKTIAVVYVHSDRGDGPTSHALLRGAGVALEESTSRAGNFKVVLLDHVPAGQDPVDFIGPWFGTSMALLAQGDLQPLPLLVSALQTHPTEVSQCFRVTPSLGRQGEVAAAWAKRQTVRRVFFIYDDQNSRSRSIGIAFRTAAAASGLDVRGCAWAATPATEVVRVDDILAMTPDLIFYAGEDAPYVRTHQFFSRLRQEGFKGPLITGDADPEVSLLATRPDLVEGTYLVSPFAPGPPELAKALGTTPGPHVTAGYFAMKAALEAIDLANSAEPEELQRAAARLPYFDAQGGATLRKCALYVARNGRFEFVELLD